MGPFSSEPDLHVQWLLVRRLLAAGQLKQSFGIDSAWDPRVLLTLERGRSMAST